MPKFKNHFRNGGSKVLEPQNFNDKNDFKWRVTILICFQYSWVLNFRLKNFF